MICQIKKINTLIFSYFLVYDGSDNTLPLLSKSHTLFESKFFHYFKSLPRPRFFGWLLSFHRLSLLQLLFHLHSFKQFYLLLFFLLLFFHLVIVVWAPRIILFSFQNIFRLIRRNLGKLANKTRLFLLGLRSINILFLK